LRDLLIKIFKTKTLKDSGITFLGVGINGILGLVFYLVLARFLGPLSFGIFSVAVTTLTLLTDIADIGSDTGTVRFVGKYIQVEKEKALKFLKLSLKVRLISWLVVLVIGCLFSHFVVIDLIGKPELDMPIRIAILGVGGALLFSFSTYSLQAVQKFWVWSGLNIGMNLLRLVLLVGLIFLSLLNLDTGLILYIVIPFIGFFVGLFFLPKFLTIKGESSVAKEFFSYNVWVAVFTLIAAISSRLDTFLSARLLTLRDVGIYSVALQLASIVSQVVFALGTVVAPKLSGMSNDEEAKKYLKKLQIFTLSLVVIGISIGIPLAKIFIPILYGNAYLESITPFTILLFAQSIFLLSIPVHMATFYYFGYPKLFVWISLGNLAIIGGLGWVLISNLGFIGAAITVLIGNTFNFIVPAIWVINRFKKRG
jgi:O-antigen/teichoic acid export membrane protein